MTRDEFDEQVKALHEAKCVVVTTMATALTAGYCPIRIRRHPSGRRLIQLASIWPLGCTMGYACT